ncbi:MAG: hypothetical protein U1F36_08775 [Planctomycetota bacterium]
MALSEAQVAELLGILTAPVTDFDCGTLCAPSHGGIPVCCHGETIQPVLYRAEFALLRRRSTMWSRHRGQGVNDAAELRPCEMFADCKGHTRCEREHRALSCRTFPFEPYLDHDDRLAGLVFVYDLMQLCPLIGSGHRIRDDFIEQCGRMFARLFEFDPDERELWAMQSRALRRSFGRAGAKIAVYRKDGVFPYPTSRESWRRARRRGEIPRAPIDDSTPATR